MKELYLIDGYGGSPKVNWLDWVGNQIGNDFQVKKVFVARPSESIVDKFDRALVEQINEVEDAYFVCHSLGCVSLLRYLINSKRRPKGIIFVSPFDQHISEYDMFDDFFVHDSLEFVSMASHNSIVISGQDDPIIPWQFSQQIAKKLTIPFLLLPTGGHFRATEGVITLPEVISYINNHWKQ